MTIGSNNQFPEFIIDEKYILREQKYSDAEAFLAYYSLPEVSRYILSSIPYKLSDSQEEIIYWIDLFYKKMGIYWAIARKDNNEMIGAIGFHGWNKYNNRAEVSYDLNQQYWRQGIMFKAMKIVLKYAFEVLKVNRVQASTVKNNIASIKILEKIGFLFDGRLREYRYHCGKYYDVEMYSLLRSDFI